LPLRWGFNLAVIAIAVSVSVWQRLWFLETFGWGLGLLLLFVIAAAFTLRYSPRYVLALWRYWAAAFFWGAAAWALLGYFNGGPEAMEEHSLGGRVGVTLGGNGGAVGVALIAVYLTIGLSVLTPRGALRFYKWLAWRMWRLVASVGQGALKVVDVVVWRIMYLWPRRRPVEVIRMTPRPKVITVEGGAPPEQVPPVPVAVVSPPEEAPALPTKTSVPLRERLRGILKRNGHQENGPAAGSSRAQAEPRPVKVETLDVRAKANGWRLPPLELLDEIPEARVSEDEGQKRAKVIEETLASFGVEVKVTEINPGPTVTQFGVEPGWVRKFKEVRERDKYGQLRLDKDGNPVVKKVEDSRTRVKVDSILNLEKDLALALAALIRMEAPVPGKSVVGIEVPNGKLGMVGLRETMESPQFQRLAARARLAVALGKGTGGEPVVFDLTKMPHLLIAGATGSGKSVNLNALLCCLMMKSTPEELRLILIDPKRVEFQTFQGLPHLLTPVVTETDTVVAVLRWANQEMDSRYKQFQREGARNIENYNRLHKDHDSMPYLVIAIDEMADLMVTAPVDVEHSVTRLAQLGRAAGIHLLVATQRPSVDVITGLIKANFPARVSFNVTSVVDSRTILDMGGAEKLLGRGDMLFLPPDAPKPKRLQGCFLSDKESERLVRYWRDQQALERPPQIPEQDILDLLGGADAIKKDPLLEKARQVAHTHSRISTSLLQRKLGIGYNRAANLLEALEEEGLVAPKGRTDSRETVASGIDDEG
jgi:S-DNA-T family DNA segregation ATPase FtsK/SpoIIIE